MAAELSELYPEVANKLADLFSRIADNDARLCNLHGLRPAGVSLHLLGAELEARGLDHFGPQSPSIAEQLRLPNWRNSTLNFWPPPSVPFGVAAVAVMPVPRHAGPNWFEGREERAAEWHAEGQRVAAYYERQQRQREER